MAKLEVEFQRNLLVEPLVNVLYQSLTRALELTKDS